MTANKIISSILAVIITFQALPALVKAELVGTEEKATLSLSLSAEEVIMGEEFSADIYLNTNGEDVVVVAAYINYDADSISINSIDVNGSVFGMGFEQSFDNVNGTIKITRAEPTPGVNTANGFVARINFTAIAATAPAADNITFDFTPGSTLDSNVILDDGQGTDILSGVYNERVTVREPATVALTPATSTLKAGDTLELILSVNNVTDFANIITDITYDENVLTFLEADFQEFENVCPFGFAFEDYMMPGINIYAECWDGLSGNVKIATLRFTAVGESVDSPVAAENIMMVDKDWNDIAFAVLNSTVTVDITAPVITVLGDNPATVEKGAVYTDAGATAEDNIDGDITQNITVDNPVNTAATSTYIVRYNVSDEAGNAAEEKTRTVNVIDTTPPGRSNRSPAGSLAANTAATTLSLTTDEPAECRFSASAGSPYASMTPMSVTASITHSQTVSGLANGLTYNYYIKCRDLDANITPDDYVISFSVNNPAPAPVSGGGGGGGGGFSPAPAPASVYPFKPENITAERTAGGMVLNWDNPSDLNFGKTVIIKSQENLASYLTYEALAGLGEKIYEGAGTAYTDANISPNLNYYYAFTAINKNGLAGSPVVILRSAVIADKPAPEKPLPAEPRPSGSRPKNLGGLPSGEVELFSLIEAEEVFHHNRFVNLNETTNRLYALIAGKSPHNLSEQDKFAIAFFIHEGTVTTVILGAGERAGVLNSYLSVFGKLPRSEDEWQDIIKIANGRWPNERRAAAENKAKDDYFRIVYRRAPNMEHPHDNAAVTVITYGLRPAERNLDSERAAIRIFRAIFRHAPESAIDWDIVRAIAYSGAVR